MSDDMLMLQYHLGDCRRKGMQQQHCTVLGLCRRSLYQSGTPMQCLPQCKLYMSGPLGTCPETCPISYVQHLGAAAVPQIELQESTSAGSAPQAG